MKQHISWRAPLFALATAIVMVTISFARPTPAALARQEAGIDAGIAWYGVLADGLAEAGRTGKPILLISAAPQCIGVSGMW